MNRIKNMIKNPCKIIAYYGMKGYFKWIPDKLYLSICFKAVFNRKISWENPVSFNEKLQWLKIYNRQNTYTILVDKYEVKKYVADIIGNEYIIPTLGVWERFEDIDFEVLPEKFVLKCTHDSGGIVLCKNKSQLDIDKVKEKLESNLKHNFFYNGREWPYKNVKPRIVAEKYLEVDDLEDLKDYKLMCFNGEVKCSLVCSDRYTASGLKIVFYDRNWNKLPFVIKDPMYEGEIDKPQKYDKMIQLAERLARGIPFVRVDFYEVMGKVYFGEMTFFPVSGLGRFSPEEWDEVLGVWIKLPN